MQINSKILHMMKEHGTKSMDGFEFMEDVDFGYESYGEQSGLFIVRHTDSGKFFGAAWSRDPYSGFDWDGMTDDGGDVNPCSAEYEDDCCGGRCVAVDLDEVRPMERIEKYWKVVQ